MSSYEDERRRLLWKMGSQFCAGFPSIHDELDSCDPEGEDGPASALDDSEIQIERQRMQELAKRLGEWIDSGTSEQGEYFEASADETQALRDAVTGALGYLDLFEVRAWAEICARRAAPGRRYEAFANALNFVADDESGRGRRSQHEEYLVAQAYREALSPGSSRELRSPWLDEPIGMQRVVKLPPPPVTPEQACAAVQDLFGFPSYGACRQALMRIRTKVITEWERVQRLKEHDPEQGSKEERGSWRARLIKDPADFPAPPATDLRKEA